MRRSLLRAPGGVQSLAAEYVFPGKERDFQKVQDKTFCFLFGSMFQHFSRTGVGSLALCKSMVLPAERQDRERRPLSGAAEARTIEITRAPEESRENLRKIPRNIRQIGNTTGYGKRSIWKIWFTSFCPREASRRGSI